MAMDWTKDEAARLGFEDQARRGVGICDEELMAQLMEVDFGTTILSRLRPEQRIGLMQSLLLIVANCPVDIDMAEQRAMLSGLLYSFQMGHDHALKHGRLGLE